MIVTCTRRLEFDAGHRVVGHEGKCAWLHGHRYVVEVECAPAAGLGLDGVGRVVDYSVIKERVGEWIDSNLDHGLILWAKDALIIRFTGLQQKLYRLPDNPTAENLAMHLLEVASQLLRGGTGVNVVRVRVYETPNCWADAWPEGSKQ